ncbi:hypothetical protein [Streptomyces sp. NPDC101234]|uniref:hypothetical protein n=1 Tax=Streptomyces sp. NPDC101234 TaxID=3366138 RepID=UPI0037F3BC1C
MPRDRIAKSAFAHWLLDRARLAGYDLTTHDTQASILILAAIALSDGLDEATTANVAKGLAVTPQELTEAYIHEMRQHVLTELLSHPDLVWLDQQLDAIEGSH